MGEYAQFEIDNADWNDSFIGQDFDNFSHKKDAVKTNPKLCKEIMDKYKITFSTAPEGSFIYSCLVFYQKKQFISKKQIDRCVSLSEVQNGN